MWTWLARCVAFSVVPLAPCVPCMEPSRSLLHDCLVHNIFTLVSAVNHVSVWSVGCTFPGCAGFCFSASTLYIHIMVIMLDIVTSQYRRNVRGNVYAYRLNRTLKCNGVCIVIVQTGPCNVAQRQSTGDKTQQNLWSLNVKINCIFNYSKVLFYILSEKLCYIDV